MRQNPAYVLCMRKGSDGVQGFIWICGFVLGPSDLEMLSIVQVQASGRITNAAYNMSNHLAHSSLNRLVC